MEIIRLILRVSLMYVYVLAVMRLSGKRTIGNLSPFDFVIATVIGDFFDDVFLAEVPVIQGVTAIATLIALNILVAWLASRHLSVRRLLKDSRTLVIQEGRFSEEGLRKERTSRNNVFSALRLQKIAEDELSQIQAAAWEPNGRLSVLQQVGARPAQKKDLYTGEFKG